MSKPDPRISWMSLAKGTRVIGSDGQEAGRVSEVVGDKPSDIFSGIAVRSGLLSDELFVPAEFVADIRVEEVILSIPADNVENLGPYEP